jgi:molybdate transport system permease protein
MVRADRLFLGALSVLGLSYVVLIALLLAADLLYVGRSAVNEGTLGPLWRALAKPEIRHAVALSLISCTMAAVLSLWVAVPVGYLLSRTRFPGRNLVDAILDIPIVLPPLVVGLSLLILFQFPPFTIRLGDLLPWTTRWDALSLNRFVVYQVPAVVLAQFMVAAAFAVRTMKATFDHLDPRCEQVALTLGCSRSQAFWRVVLPESGHGLITAFTLAWARALGEFGPVLVFAGATRNKTEVLPTTVFLELSIGDLQAAVTVSLVMVVAAVIVLTVARVWGQRDMHL